MWSCHDCCEKPPKSLKKRVTESDLPFRKIILGGGVDSEGREPQPGQLVAETVQLEERGVRGQAREIRRENQQDLAIDWVDYEDGDMVKVGGCGDSEARHRDKEQGGSTKKILVICWLSFETQDYESSSG